MPCLFNKYYRIPVQIGVFFLTASLGTLLIGTLLNLWSYRSFSPFISPIPSAQNVGTDYLYAVLKENHSYISQERTCVHRQLKHDIARYGGANVRNVTVFGESRSGNSDHGFEITSIQFEYQPKNQAWEKGVIKLLTITNLERLNTLTEALPFRKIHCGGSLL